MMKKVLIVNEKVNDRVVVAYYVSRYFLCDIYTASSFNDALERINIIKPDVIITDMSMPVNDGITERLGIPIIVLSAMDEKAVVDQIRKSGKLAYLNKPDNLYREFESLERIFNYRIIS